METTVRKTKWGGRAFLLLLPFLLFFSALFFLSIYVFQTVVEETAYFPMIVGNTAPRASEDLDTGFVPGSCPSTLTRIPSIRYGRQFARLNVKWAGGGWNIVNIPVYLGSDKNTLKKGAGMSFASFFPGEKGCTIISAHVTRHFAELETTPIGAVVTIETSYGPYQYVVAERFDGVSGTDRWYMDSSSPYDLILYSCFPRDNKGERRTNRCVVCCMKTDGAEVAE
jgi:Sortase (surface protein transpeptidase)